MFPPIVSAEWYLEKAENSSNRIQRSLNEFRITGSFNGSFERILLARLSNSADIDFAIIPEMELHVPQLKWKIKRLKRLIIRRNWKRESGWWSKVGMSTCGKLEKEPILGQI